MLYLLLFLSCCSGIGLNASPGSWLDNCPSTYQFIQEQQLMSTMTEGVGYPVLFSFNLDNLNANKSLLRETVCTNDLCGIGNVVIANFDDYGSRNYIRPEGPLAASISPLSNLPLLIFQAVVVNKSHVSNQRVVWICVNNQLPCNYVMTSLGANTGGNTVDMAIGFDGRPYIVYDVQTNDMVQVRLTICSTLFCLGQDTIVIASFNNSLINDLSLVLTNEYVNILICQNAYSSSSSWAYLSVCDSWKDCSEQFLNVTCSYSNMAGTLTEAGLPIFALIDYQRQNLYSLLCIDSKCSKFTINLLFTLVNMSFVHYGSGLDISLMLDGSLTIGTNLVDINNQIYSIILYSLNCSLNECGLLNNHKAFTGSIQTSDSLTTVIDNNGNFYVTWNTLDTRSILLWSCPGPKVVNNTVNPSPSSVPSPSSSPRNKTCDCGHKTSEAKYFGFMAASFVLGCIVSAILSATMIVMCYCLDRKYFAAYPATTDERSLLINRVRD